MAKVIKNNYSSGELDPRLHDRFDLDAHANGAESLRNCALLPQGGFRRRDGSEFQDELLPLLTRVTSGVTITAPEGGTTANANDGDESSPLTTTTNIGVLDPYVVVHYDLGSAKTIKFADVVGFVLPNDDADFEDFFIQYSADDATWVSLLPYVPVGNSTRGQVTRRRLADVSARYWRFARIGATDYGANTLYIGEFNLWQASAELSDSRIVDFTFSTEQSYALLFTDGNARVYRDGVRTADVRTRMGAEQLDWMNWTQSLDTLILQHPDVAPSLIKREGDDGQWNSTNFSPESVEAVLIATHTVASGGFIQVSQYHLANTGAAQWRIFAAGAFNDFGAKEWLAPRRTVVAGEYEVRATAVSGAPDSGATGTWLDLATSRLWSKATGTAVLFMEIRDAVTLAVLSSATITLQA